MVDLLATFVIQQNSFIMETGFLHIHSLFRWLALVFLLIAIVKSFVGLQGKKPFTKGDNIIALILLSVTHLQFIVGLVIYFMRGWSSQLSNMGNSTARFWALEHGLSMIVAVVLITVGRVRSKKAPSDELKHKRGYIMYALAFLIVLWAGLIKPYALGRGLF